MKWLRRPWALGPRKSLPGDMFGLMKLQHFRCVQSRHPGQKSISNHPHKNMTTRSKASPDLRRPGWALHGQLPQRGASEGRAGGEQGASGGARRQGRASSQHRLFYGRAWQAVPLAPHVAPSGSRGPAPASRRGPAESPAPRMAVVADEGAERK